MCLADAPLRTGRGEDLHADSEELKLSPKEIRRPQQASADWNKQVNLLGIPFMMRRHATCMSSIRQKPIFDSFVEHLRLATCVIFE